MHSDSPLDIKIKGGMIKDMLNISGIQIPQSGDVTNGQVKTICPGFRLTTATPGDDDSSDGYKSPTSAAKSNDQAASTASKDNSFAATWATNPEAFGNISACPVVNG